MDVVDEPGRADIDEALSDWRQGDCVLGEHWFLFRLDVDAPLTEPALEAAAQSSDAGEAEVRGCMVATQTCDLVRACGDRPFVEVCPLVEVDSQVLEEIRRHRRPSYAFVPGVAVMCLVADLDRVMTVEKAVVAKWERRPGCTKDSERRNLSLALSRKRARSAFPHDFVELASGLSRRMAKKHEKNSAEGRALRSLREIRVRAAPDWGADCVSILLLFIKEADESNFEDQEWSCFLEEWMNRLPSSGRFVAIEGAVRTLDDLTAREYVESDPLDLDYLSSDSEECVV